MIIKFEDHNYEVAVSAHIAYACNPCDSYFIIMVFKLSYHLCATCIYKSWEYWEHGYTSSKLVFSYSVDMAVRRTQPRDVSPTRRNEVIATSVVVPCVVVALVIVTVVVVLILKRKIITTWFKKVHTCTAVIVGVLPVRLVVNVCMYMYGLLHIH